MSFENVLNWCAAIMPVRTERREQMINTEIEREATRDIQIMEFDGELYISHNNEPIVRMDDLSRPIVEVLKSSRKSWIKHRLTNLR